jgi:hypothetical protein
MKKITKKELKTILEQHELWLVSNEKEGNRADLSGANLTSSDLSGANLTSSDLTGADLSDADLFGADLTGANLSGANLTCAHLTRADLTDANLTGANLRRADLRGADLRFANLRGADLTCTNLTCVNLYGADLTRADLSGADLINSELEYTNLTDTILDDKEQCRKGIVLTEPITGYKKAYSGKIITLEIPIGAKVFSINNNKRRTNKAKVIDMQGETELSSWYNTNFKYHVGDEIEIEDFDENYNIECAEGLHFFLTRKEAEKYLLI